MKRYFILTKSVPLFETSKILQFTENGIVKSLNSLGDVEGVFSKDMARYLWMLRADRPEYFTELSFESSTCYWYIDGTRTHVNVSQLVIDRETKAEGRLRLTYVGDGPKSVDQDWKQ